VRWRRLSQALAIAGVFSFGLTTIAYFMLWGWRDRHVAYAAGFCDTCSGESSEVTTGLDLTTINFVNAGRLVGAAERCDTCGSTIKTHCFYLFGMPIFSSGSFRVQCPAMGQYILRKRSFYRRHVLQIVLLPVVLLGFALAIYLSMD
jgi:hypothetical protein